MEIIKLKNHRSRGRPSVISEKIRTDIRNALRCGLHIDVACILSGVDKKTYYNWLKRRATDDKDGKATEFTEFVHSVKKALAEAELTAMQVILTAGSQAWQAMAWFLERRFADRWAKRNTGTVALSLPLASTPPKVSPKGSD